MINKKIIQQNFSRQATIYNDCALVQKNSAKKLCELAKKILTENNFVQSQNFTVSENSLTELQNKNINILDLGSGTSFIAKNLHEFNQNLKIFEVDIAENMLKQWVDRPSNILPILADIENLPFEKTASFDIIISSFALQWIENIPQLLRKLKILLKENGALIFCLPTEKTFAEIKSASEKSQCNFSIKTLHNENFIRDELLKLKLQEHFYQTEIVPQKNQNAVAALKEIKKIGANYSEKFATKKNISKNNLQKFNDFFLQDNQNITNWHLAYFIFKK